MYSVRVYATSTRERIHSVYCEKSAQETPRREEISDRVSMVVPYTYSHIDRGRRGRGRMIRPVGATGGNSGKPRPDAGEVQRAHLAPGRRGAAG